MDETKFQTRYPYGALYTVTGQQYLLLLPEPVVRDSWQPDHQQRFLVTPYEPIGFVAGKEVYSYARHIITTNPTIEYREFTKPIVMLRSVHEEISMSVDVMEPEYVWPDGYKSNKDVVNG